MKLLVNLLCGFCVVRFSLSLVYFFEGSVGKLGVDVGWERIIVNIGYKFVIGRFFRKVIFIFC